MKITELFRRLSYGELSNLSLSQDGSGEILDKQRPRLIQYVNEGLLRLHSRFVLREKELLIEQLENVRNYPLEYRFAVSSDSDEPYHFIIDSDDAPFASDVIRILQVYDDCGLLPLNDLENCNSLFTPQPNLLQVPVPRGGQSLWVIYQARHPKLDDREEHALNQEFELPFYLEGALQAFVAHKVFSHMNGQENALKAQEFLTTYETICLEVEEKDLANQTHHTSHLKFWKRGFV